MKQLLLYAAIIFAATAFGQTKNGAPSGTSSNTTIAQASDTALQVVYVEKHKSNQQPAYLINGRLVKHPSLPSGINPKTIENIEVRKRDTLIDNVLYRGQIFIETRKDYTPRFITLTELKAKYTNFKGKPAVFMLDGNFINADYDHYLVDETNLLTIIIDNLQMPREQIELGLIKLLSKTDENIKARKQILIRGSELTMRK